jgi:hypothetical protein
MFCTQIYMGASNMVFEDLFGIKVYKPLWRRALKAHPGYTDALYALQFTGQK